MIISFYQYHIINIISKFERSLSFIKLAFFMQNHTKAGQSFSVFFDFESLRSSSTYHEIDITIFYNITSKYQGIMRVGAIFFSCTLLELYSTQSRVLCFCDSVCWPSRVLSNSRPLNRFPLNRFQQNMGRILGSFQFHFNIHGVNFTPLNTSNTTTSSAIF